MGMNDPLIIDLACINGQYNALRSKFSCKLFDEFWILNGSGINTYFISSGFEQGCNITFTTYPTSNRKWNVNVLCNLPDNRRESFALFIGCRNVQEHQLVSTLLCIGRCKLNRVASIADVHKIDAFHSSPILNVEARYDSFG